MSQQNKDVLLYCKFCSKVVDNKCNLSSHERACERKNKHKQMLEQNKHLLLYCKVCSKVMDNKPNLLKHEQLCGKKAEHKEMLQKKKTCTLEIHANMKRQLHLKNQYDQINSECDNISVKRKQVEQKIRDRQYEKSKLQSQLSNRIFHHDNNKLYSHLEKQINSLDEQISKFVLLVKQLSQDESELSNRKCGIEQEMKQINDNISTYRQTRSTLNEQAPQMNKTSDISKHTHESSICISDNLSIKQARKRSISEVTESEAIVKEQTIKKMKVDYITKKRLSTDFKTLENDQNHLRIALKRKSPNYVINII